MTTRRRALMRMGIEGRLRDLPVGSMSAGQKRRVSIAAVVARRPRLWLLDEPHAGLDQDGRDTVDQLVRDATAGGATVIVASHELERARRNGTALGHRGRRRGRRGLGRTGAPSQRAGRRRPDGEGQERSECLKCQEWPMWGEIALVTGKDLRIERRSRVGITQIAPFAVTVLVLFGFALEGDTATLRTFTAGLFWVTVRLHGDLGGPAVVHRRVGQRQP